MVKSLRLRGFGRIAAAAATVALMGVLAAGCGQQQATGQAKAAQPPSNVPVLAVVSEALEGPCVVQTEYQHGANVILRIKLFSPATGQQLTDKDLSAVNVVLPDGTKLPARFGVHESGKIPFWVAKWTVPASYPTGDVNYTLDVQGTNRKVEQVKFDTGDAPSFLDILPGTCSGDACGG